MHTGLQGKCINRNEQYTHTHTHTHTHLLLTIHWLFCSSVKIQTNNEQDG